MFYSPIKLAIGGIVAWLVVWLVTPVDVVGQLAPGALAYALLAYGGFMIGSLVGGDKVVKAETVGDDQWYQPVRAGLYWITMALGVVGIALRVIDRVYLRGIEYGMNAVELRDALAATGATWVGIVASILFPLCLIPLMLVLASRERSRFLLLLGAIVFVLPMTENLFQLSRSFLILTLGVGFATVVMTRFKGDPFHRRLLALSAVGVLGLLAASTIIFSARIEASDSRLTDSIYDSAYAMYLQPNRAAQTIINSGSDLEAFGVLAVLPNGMYYISGVYEFSALWLRPDGQKFAGGQILLYPFVRVIQKISGVEGIRPDQIEDYVYRDGVFQTFFGPLWVDFGWLGPFAMIFFGYITAWMARRVRGGSVALFPIYVYLAMVVFFMPVVNFLVSGFGMFCVTSFSIFALIAQRQDDAGGRALEGRRAGWRGSGRGARPAAGTNGSPQFNRGS